MHIDWATLGAIAVVAAATALTTVLLVAFALVAMPARSRPAEDGSRTAGGTGTAARSRAVGTTVAGACLLSAGLIVGYGLYLIIA